MTLFSELKRRKVIRMVVAYLLVGWALIQIADATFEPLNLPAWAGPMVVWLVALGFPVAVILAWVLDVTPEGIKVTTAETPESATRPKPPDLSIAVLPFVNMSDDVANEYFCDGLTEELLNLLGNIKGLRVSSRTSSFAFKDQAADIKAVARALNVAYILEGSVRKAGKHLRISGQLIDAANDAHLWTETYDRELDDIFIIQDEIAQAITSILSLTIKHRQADTTPVDPEAYDFFLHGLGYFARHNLQDTLYARQMFKRALAVDPGFGRAWAGLASTYGFEYLYLNATDVNLEEARRTSAKALELGPDLAESHVAAGIMHCMSKQYAQAEAAFERAVELDPKSFDAWYFFARAKVHEGKLEKAVELFGRASKVRPEDYQSLLLQAQLYISLDKHDKALKASRLGIERARAALEHNPDDNRALNMGAFGLLRLGQTKEAIEWMKISTEKAPLDSITQYNAACFYSLAGEVDKALDCLENCAARVGNINREWMKNDSDLDNIRQEPRFRDIVENLSH